MRKNYESNSVSFEELKVIAGSSDLPSVDSLAAQNVKTWRKIYIKNNSDTKQGNKLKMTSALKLQHCAACLFNKQSRLLGT